MSTAPGRPRTACKTCKGQKIGCSGVRPSCARCTRLKYVCIYENARLRANIRHKKGSLRKLAMDRERSRAEGSPSRPPAVHLSQAPLASIIGDDYSLGSSAMVQKLVSLYFDNVYQSDLVLHRKSFTESITSGSMSIHVLLSVCAWGANFYQDEFGKFSLRDNGFMLDCAKRAGELVFKDINYFEQENLVTFFNLALFWHSQGDWRAGYLYKGNACQLLHIVGVGDQPPDEEDSFESEVRRRRFWACYFMHCFSSEKLFNFDAIADVETLPLPWTEEDYEAGFTSSPSITLSSTRKNGGVFSYLIEGIRQWSTVSCFIKAAKSFDSAKLASTLALDERISLWWRTVPTHFKLTKTTVGGAPQKALSKLVLLNLLYHQSLWVLHASIVPLFSWDGEEDNWHAARQLSAQIAFEHASMASSIIEAVTSTSSNLGSMASFVAYAAYSGCAVQIPFMWCSNSEVRDAARVSVGANIKMIQAMGIYWKLASILQVHVRCLFGIHKKDPPLLEGEPKACQVSSLMRFPASSPYARSSILEFGGILISTRGASVDLGEDSDDLRLQMQGTASRYKEQERASSAAQGIPRVAHDDEQGGSHTQVTANLATSQAGMLVSDSGVHDGTFNHDALRCGQAENTQSREHFVPEQPQIDTLETSVLEVFNPFSDPEMLSLFPGSEMFDFGSLETDFLDLDYLNL